MLLSLIALVAFLGVLARADENDRILSLPDYGPMKSKNYAGYIDVPGGRKAFYYFIESEGSPANDPLVLFLNGGPGCSSMLAWGTENGPYTIRHGGAFDNNTFGWSTLANIIYIDSPPGVGFSIDSTPPITWNDTNTAQFNYNAIQGWFTKFPDYANHKFFLTGESYAGHYVPQLATLILNGPDKQLLARMNGFMIGNPCTGTECGYGEPPGLRDYLRYHGFDALNTSIPSNRHSAQYDRYDILVPICKNTDLLARVKWPHPIVDALRASVSSGGAPVPYGPCSQQRLGQYLRRPDVVAALRVEQSLPWHECVGLPQLNYTFNPDPVTNLYPAFFDNTKWDLLIYSGTADTVVNFVATQTVVNNFGRALKNPIFSKWSYPYVYNTSQTQLGGFYLEYDRISWAGVRDAGHMVPMYNPPEAHELFRSYLTLGRPGRLT